MDIINYYPLLDYTRFIIEIYNPDLNSTFAI